MDFQIRIKKVRQFLGDKGFDCIIITGSSNIFYLTGLYGIEGYLCITNKGNIGFFTSGIFYQYVCDRLKNMNIPDFSPEIFNKKLFVKFLKGFKNQHYFLLSVLFVPGDIFAVKQENKSKQLMIL